jgi:hypothetical protein
LSEISLTRRRVLLSGIFLVVAGIADPGLRAVLGPPWPYAKADLSPCVAVYAGVCALLRDLQPFCRVKSDRVQDKNSGIYPDRQTLSCPVILRAR